MTNEQVVATAERLGLVTAVFFWTTLVGIGVLTLARGRRWTVPAWTFIAAPWPACGASLAVLLHWRAVLVGQGPPVGRGLPPQGPFAGLPATANAVAAVAMLVGVGLLVRVAPPRRLWTWRSGVAAVAAALLSWGWCLVLATIDPNMLASTPYAAFTITVPDGFTGRAWVFEDRTAGTPPRWVLGSAHYELPANGVLVTRDIGPMRATPRVFWPRGVTVRTTAGRQIPWVRDHDVCRAYRREREDRDRRGKSAPDRPALPKPCWSVALGRSDAGGFEELFIGDADWMAREFLGRERLEPVSATDVLWWNDRPDRHMGPSETTVNGAMVEWRHMVGEHGGHAFETTWTPSDATSEPLRFELIVTRGRTAETRDSRMTLTVRNAGTGTVDGWALAFSTPYAIRLSGSYTYYSQQVVAEDRVPCTPLLPQRARRARHEFVRRPGARPLAPGDKEEFQFEIVDDFIVTTPTLEWARSLAAPAG